MNVKLVALTCYIEMACAMDLLLVLFSRHFSGVPTTGLCNCNAWRRRRPLRSLRRRTRTEAAKIQTKSQRITKRTSVADMLIHIHEFYEAIDVPCSQDSWAVLLCDEKD